jgi:flagellar biosynthesis protein
MSDQPRPGSEQHRRKAVAVRYRQDADHAPHVLAKGQGDTAERIIALAKKHGIPLHEDRDLVQLLGLLELDAEIPPTMYRALAEVLAHLYRANAKASQRPPPTQR